MKEIISTDKAAAPKFPYNQAVLCNGTLYISGLMGVDLTSGQLKVGLEAQTRTALDNMGHILQEAGMSYSDVVKTTVLLKSMEDFAKINEAYKSYFSSEFPARAAYQVVALPLKEGLVEIEGVAVRGAGGPA